VKKRLTRYEMAQQLREEAEELLRLAIELEGSHSRVEPEVSSHIQRKEGLTLESLIEAMDGKMRRKQSLSEIMGVPMERLDELMTRENGFHMTERGWWKYDPT
jgi:hypothetical protein